MSSPVCCLALVALAASLAGQAEPAASSVRVAVYDVGAAAPLEGAFVALAGDAQQFTATTTANGSALFDGLQAANGVATTWMTIEVQCDGYVPFKAAAPVRPLAPRIHCPLVPLSAHCATPVIAAASGGTFDLPGFGRLRVEPGALAQDCALRAVAVPMESWSLGLLEGPLGERVLCDQVWLQIVDANGLVLPDSVLRAPTGITLQRRLPFVPGLPGGVSEVTWQVHHLGAAFDGTVTHEARVTAPEAEFPLAVGHNGLTCAYTVTSVDGESLPWQIEYVGKGTRTEVGGCAHVSCGEYTAAASARVDAGETRASRHSLDAEAAEQVGCGGDAGFARIAAASRLRIDGGFARPDVAATLIGRSIAVSSGQRVADDPRANCTCALHCTGVLYVTYEVWARRRTVDGRTRNRRLGEIEVCEGLGAWFENVAWSGDCRGCGPNAMPADLPGAGRFVF